MTLEEARRLWRALGFPDAGDAGRVHRRRPGGAEHDGRRRRPGRDRLRHRRPADPRGRADDGPARRLGGGHARRPGSSSSRPATRPPAAGSAARCGSSEEVGRAVRAAAGLLLAPAPRGRGRPGRGARRQRRPTCTPPRSRSASPTWSGSPRCPTSSTRTGSATWSRSSSRAAPTWSPPQRGRVIKTLGDSVLFVSEDPTRAMDIALGIVDVIGHDSRLPDVRIGLATGSVVMQLGDVFGPPVNLAARLTGVARRNRVITDRAHRRPAAPGAVRHPAAAGPSAARVRRRGAGRRTPALSGARDAGRHAPFGSRMHSGMTRPAVVIPGQSRNSPHQCPFCLFTLINMMSVQGVELDATARRVWRDGSRSGCPTRSSTCCMP